MPLLSLLTLVISTTTSTYLDCRTKRCRGKSMICQNNEDCIVDCAFDNDNGVNSDDEACQSAAVQCPTNAKCEVICDGNESCERLTVNAEDSTNLTVSCGASRESCEEINIYCPTTGRCDITADNSNKNVVKFMEIFAVNGLNTVTFSASNTLETDIALRCGSQYENACNLTLTAPFDRCASGDTICENPPTTDPSSQPSNHPVLFTSDYPSSHPSESPITANPSSAPSKSVANSITNATGVDVQLVERTTVTGDEEEDEEEEKEVASTSMTSFLYNIPTITMIIVIVCAAVALCLSLVLLFIWCVCISKRKKEMNQAAENMKAEAIDIDTVRTVHTSTASRGDMIPPGEHSMGHLLAKSVKLAENVRRLPPPPPQPSNLVPGTKRNAGEIQKYYEADDNSSAEDDNDELYERMYVKGNETQGAAETAGK